MYFTVQNDVKRSLLVVLDVSGAKGFISPMTHITEPGEGPIGDASLTEQGANSSSQTVQVDGSVGLACPTKRQSEYSLVTK